jgi:hypothetical protein
MAQLVNLRFRSQAKSEEAMLLCVHWPMQRIVLAVVQLLAVDLEKLESMSFSYPIGS